MLKNRFFKSTQGVPYELAVATSAPAVSVTAEATTTFTTIAGGTPANGDFYLLRQNPTTGVVTAAKNSTDAASGWRVNTTYKGWPHQLAWCANGTNKQFYLTSQFIPEKCDPMEKYGYSAAVAQKSTMTSNVIPGGVNQELFFKLIETTPGNIPLPSWEYTVLLTPSVTEAQAWTTITAAITAAKDNEWFTAVAGSNGITITGSTATNPNQVGRTFKLVATLSPTKSDPIDYGVTFTTNYTTSPNVAASLGVGTPAIAEDMFTEALVRQGIGHFYTPAGTTASEFGVPGSLASIVGTVTGTGYNIYKISGVKTETSKTPMGVLSNKFYIFVLVDADSTDTAKFEMPFGGSAYNQ
jgi:hypothetical protein